MNKDEIIEMARQAGFVDYELDDGTTDAVDVRYETFAKLVAEHVYAKYLELPEPKQSDTIAITTPIGYLCENAVGHKYFRWRKPSSTYKPIALYTALPQSEQGEIRMTKPRLDQGADYERGFVDGAQHQMKSSVDLALEAMRIKKWVGLTDEELREFDVDPIEAKLMIAKLKEKNT